jgi:CHAT domain-containing protein/Tfp pilus assembly protein PilF
MVRANATFRSLRGNAVQINRVSVCFLYIFVFWLIPLTLQNTADISDRFDEAVQLFYYKEYDRSLEILYTLTEKICSETEFSEKCVKSALIKSNVYRYKREFKKSEEYILRALGHAEELLDPHHPITVRLNAEYAYLKLETSGFEAGMEYARRALDIIENGDLTGRPRAIGNIVMGIMKSSGGDYHASIEHYRSALQAVEHAERSIEIINVLAQAHNNIGVSYRRLGQIDKAMEHYRTNLSLVRDAFGNNHIELAYAYNSIGSVYYTTGDYGTAGDHFYMAAEIIRQNHGENNNLYAGALNNAAVSFHRTGDLDRSVEMLETAQKIKENTLGHDHPDTAVGYANIASIHAENENFQEALENYHRSLSVRESIHGSDHPHLVPVLMKLGEFYITTGEYEQARERLHESLRIIETRIGKNHPDAWEVRINIGRSFIEEERFDEAEDHIKKALHMMIDESGIALGSKPEFSLLSHPLQFLFGLKAMADLQLKTYRFNNRPDNLYDAFYFYELASEVIDFLQREYQSEASKLNLIDQNYSIYTNAIHTSYYLFNETGHDKWLDEILRISEMSRSKIALELLQDMDARNFAGVSDEILDRERELNQNITRLYQQLNTEQARGDEADEVLVSEYRDSLFYLNEDMVRFTEELERQYPAYYELKYDQQLADREQIQSLLTPDETMVNYILAEENIFVVLIDHQQMNIRKIDKSGDLTERILSLRRAVATDSLDLVTENSSLLYSQLVEPLLADIHTNSLIIVPDQALHYLPFEMLLTRKPGHQNYHEFPYLIKEKQIMYAPSATVLQRMTDRRPERPRNLLAMAPFNQYVMDVESPNQLHFERFYANLTPLPLTRFETREIARLFRTRQHLVEYIFPNHTDILLDRNATKDFLITQSLNSYSYIHLATHAFVNESNPNLSGIALWGDEEDDGILYVNDIYNLRMNADLVVLGACETGLGTTYRGEGMIGFTRAFIHAGASNLVVSMWRVNDQPTSDLMVRFYRYIRDGHSYSESLRKAKLDLISHPDYAEPKNWAAFILQGR